MNALIIICVVSFISKASCLEPIFLRQTPKHGTAKSDSTNSFMCPGSGAITNIKYWAADYIYGLEFTCSSSDGIRVFGPYGSEIGTTGNFTCPKDQYISSFYGNSSEFLCGFGVVCRSITDDLKGNGTDLGSVVDTRRVGPAFDDYGYAFGARIVNVTIYSTSAVVGIKLDYANIPVELCTVNCSNYQEEFTPLYGNTGTKCSVFTCPEDGAFNAIKTKVTLGVVKAVQFTCISGVGEWTSPVFGQDMGTSNVQIVKCPPNLIFGSMHGRNGSTNVIALGIRCVELGETGESPKYDAQGGVGGTLFDGVEYSNNGLRVIQLRIYYDSSEIKGIQIKYGNSDYNANCEVRNIEVIDESAQATFEGFEVIGITADVSCGNVTQKLKLDYSQGKTQEITITVDKGGSKTYANDVSISGAVGFSLKYFSATVGLGYSRSDGGADIWSSSESKTTSTTTGQYAATEISYVSPGACIIIGYVARYKVDQDNAKVRYHYTCANGEKASTLGLISLKSTTYGKAYFEDFQMRFNSESDCTPTKKTCVKNINANDASVNSSALVERFSRCFPKGSGEIH